jgi:hypothetical protein
MIEKIQNIDIDIVKRKYKKMSLYLYFINLFTNLYYFNFLELIKSHIKLIKRHLCILYYQQFWNIKDKEVPNKNILHDPFYLYFLDLCYRNVAKALQRLFT